MLFSMARGSDGFGEERYVAYLPFEVAIGATIEVPATLTVDGIETRLERLTYLYTLFSGPFNTAAAAEHQLGRLRAAVEWIALEFQIGTKPAPELRQVKMSEAPAPVEGNPNFKFLTGTGWSHTDGHYDAESAHVIPEHRRLVRFEVGRPSLNLGISAANWRQAFEHALSYERLDSVANDEPLTLAIDLYAESKALIIPRTKFITLVIALEALLPDAAISAGAAEVLKKLKQSAKESRDAHQKDSEMWQELNNLLSRVGGLERQSIGRSLRTLVGDAARTHPELGKPEEVEIQVADIYGIRSSLVHDGTADEKELDKRLTFLTSFVPHLLKILFIETAMSTN
jgi:hypothetical protein